MLEIKGKYATAKVFTNKLEETALEQIKKICSQPFVKDAQIRVMSDVHAGAGCVIGFTANLGEMVIPNIVGVDIGCGMLTVKLGKEGIDFNRLDEIIRKYVPSGMNVHVSRKVKFPKLLELDCYRELKDTKRFERSIGTLGGGNHFIEVNKDDEDNKYLVIHTGSRNLGKQVAEYYQNLAYNLLIGMDELFAKQNEIIERYKATGRKKEIQSKIKEMKKAFNAKSIDTPMELCYLTGEYREKYLKDMKICQTFATLNRYTIANSILENYFGKTIDTFESFETIHNYIDLENNMVRKGAVSAKKNEVLLIPINMKDGSLICVGKGNPDWNESAPHGAGRIYSRKKAKEIFTLEAFEKEMEGIFSTSISKETLDESPMAYKEMKDIVDHIGPTVDIVKIIKPIYNFKAN